MCLLHKQSKELPDYFKVENGYTFVSVQSNKFGGLAAFDPKNNLFNITLFTDSNPTAKILSHEVVSLRGRDIGRIEATYKAKRNSKQLNPILRDEWL